MAKRHYRDPLMDVRTRIEPYSGDGVRLSLHFDANKDDNHHAIIKPGDKRHVVASRLRELADRVMAGCSESGGSNA